MNSLAVLLVTTLGQFPVCEPVYVAPVYVAPVYTAPVVQCPKIYHNICYDGTIYTKQYVKVKLPGGKYLEVPVINGYLPPIDHRTLSDGSLVRDFRYDCRIKYTGKTPVYEPGSTCSKPPTEAPCSAEVYSSRAKTTDDAEGVACSFPRSVCRTESILFGYASEWNAPSLGVFAGGRQD